MAMNETYFIFFLIALISASGIAINISKNKKGELKKDVKDKTLTYFRIAVPLAIISAFTFYLLGIGNFAQIPFGTAASLVFILAGLIFRWASIKQLKNMFSVRLTIVEHHTLQTTGIFKIVRHPSYLGMLLYFTGLGLAMHNVLCIFLLILLPLTAILLRIKKEEIMLLQHFNGAFEDYQKHTWRLIPFVF